MARPLRIVFPGALYHVTARSQERRPLFVDDSDRERMIEQLAKSLQRYQGRLYAYVLMSNHYHLLVETPGGNLSRLMQHLNTSYTVYFNRRHRRHGHLLEGRFQARVVEGTRYLLTLTRYVHLNPVKTATRRSLPLAERVTCLRAYRWSSYRGYTGLGGAEAFINYGPLTSLVAEGRKNKRQAYREFVESGLAGKDEELRAVLNLSSKAIGEESFCREMEVWHQERVAAQPDPSSVAGRRVEVG
jgi:putative transposase